MPLRKLTGTIMPLRKLTGSLFSLKCPEHVSRDSCGKSPLLWEMDRTPLGVSCRSQTTRSLVADPEKQRGEQIERQAPTALARLCRPRAAGVDCRLGLLPDDWQKTTFELCFRTGELRYVSKRRAASHYCSRFAPGTTVVMKVDADTRIEKGPFVQCSMPSASGARLRLHTLLICQTSSGLKLRDASYSKGFLTVVMSDPESLKSSHVVPPQPREAAGNPDDGKDSARLICTKSVFPASPLLIGQRFGAKDSETLEVLLSLILLD